MDLSRNQLPLGTLPFFQTYVIVEVAYCHLVAIEPLNQALNVVVEEEVGAEDDGD